MATSPDKLKSKIMEAIKSSSEVKPGNYISVNIKSTGFLGFGKSVIELTGRANSDKDKEAIEKIARGLAEGLEVVSTLRTGRTG